MKEPRRGFSPATRKLLESLRKPQELTTQRCKACDGSGVSSRGYPCFPCNGKGQVIVNKE